MRTLTVAEALSYLKKRDVTTNEEVVRRWIRKGKIKATLASKKTGCEVNFESLVAFADAYLRMNKPTIENDSLHASERLKRSIAQLNNEIL
jgi:hypothetical protein